MGHSYEGPIEASITQLSIQFLVLRQSLDTFCPSFPNFAIIEVLLLHVVKTAPLVESQPVTDTMPLIVAGVPKFDILTDPFETSPFTRGAFRVLHRLWQVKPKA